MKIQCGYAHYREFEDVVYKHVKTVEDLVAAVLRYVLPKGNENIENIKDDNGGNYGDKD